MNTFCFLRLRALKHALLMAGLAGLLATAAAQAPALPADFPTLDALAETVVPAADPVALAQRLRGLEEIPAPPAAAPPPRRRGTAAVLGVKLGGKPRVPGLRRAAGGR